MTDSKTDDWDSPAYNEACRLVGRFIYHWALLESTLNSGVRKVLGLGVLEGAIVANNMQCRAKIHIIKTYVNLVGDGAEAWRKVAVKNLEAIASMSDKRNVVAHVPFGPHKGGGVDFITIKAKGKLAFPDMVWSKADFNRECHLMSDLAEALDQTIDKLSAIRSLVTAKSGATKEGPSKLAHLNALIPLLQGNPDCPPANLETDPQTPPETKE